MKFVKCDKCRVEIDTEKIPMAHPGIILNGPEVILSYDLCEACRWEIIKWLDEWFKAKPNSGGAAALPYQV